MSDSASESIWGPNSITFSNINTYWGHRFIETLRDLGVSRFVISPGSRNTPFTFACSRIPGIEVEVVVDERSAAFFALGWSKSSGLEPVALICTSGSALAHYLPAIIEARYGHVPLLVLSTDRPDELQNCHAGQTIDQRNIFRKYTADFWQAMDPYPDFWKYCESRLNRLLTDLNSLAPLPVHINQPFRDPLTPGIEDGLREQLVAEKKIEPEAEEPFLSDTLKIECETSPFSAERKLLIVGPLAVSAEAINEGSDFLAKWSESGSPILCDGLSTVRFSEIETVAHYDLFLRNESATKQLAPGAVFVLGDIPTSKVLRKALETWDAPSTVLSFDTGERHAGLAGNWQNQRFDSQEELKKITQYLTGEQCSEDYRQSWRRIDQLVASEIETTDAQDSLTEWLLPRDFVEAVDTLTNVWISSSMPVRDWEAFSCAKATDLRVFVNRGANGIDGLIASSCGMVRGCTCEQNFLIIGDVAFSHDVGSLALVSKLERPLTIIVINNGGGRIFKHLPIAQVEMDFEKFYLTPPQLDLAKLAEVYSIDFVAVEDRPHLRKILSERPEKSRIFSVTTDPDQDLQTRTDFINALQHKLPNEL